MDYNIARDGQQLGVFSESQIQENIGSGTCLPTDLAWCEGMVDWKPLSELFSGTVDGATLPPVPPQFYMPAQFVGSSKPSGLSIASLVCGILTFATCIITGIPAIICGHLALSKIKNSSGAIGGKGMAIAGLVMGYMSLVFGVFYFVVLAALAVPTFAKVQEKSLVVKSINNARQIVIACKLYASDHNGNYPGDLNELVKTGGISDDKILHDPLLHDDTQIGYEYFGAGMKDSDPPDKVLLMSKSADSRGKKVVAHNDGSVEVKDSSYH